MCGKSLFGGFALVLLLVAVASAEPGKEEQEAVAIPRDPKMSEQRTIPLSEIVTTSPQKDLQSINEVVGEGKAYSPYMMRFRNVEDGSSNVFLVEATNLRGALAATANVLFGSRSADTPARLNMPDPPRVNHWLVAYLGSGPSSPVWWTVESVGVEKGKVVLSYRRPKPQPATDDMRRYHFWIPVGKLDPGTYHIQLFDAEKRVATLMRRVEVPPITERGGTQ